ncbi:MAG: IPTL-CTERM sorting domain-containing protein [Thermodesulfobacteriota bacterium]
MIYKSGRLLTSVLFFILVLSAAVMFTFGGQAWGQVQTCNIEVAKVARAENLGFDFQSVDDGSVFDFTVFSGTSQLIAFDPGSEITVTETVPPGWRLEDIICFNDGIATTEIENGVIATCFIPGGFVECVFFNVETDAIPTLSEWGMIAAAAGLGLVGVWFAARRRRAQAV